MELLELIHTNINGPLSPNLCGKKFFVTFIDDHSRYGCVYLINHKLEAFDKFKIFKIEVERKLGKLIKVVRVDMVNIMVDIQTLVNPKVLLLNI